MRGPRRFFLCTVICLAVSAGMGAAAPQSLARAAPKALRVLFVGNSFTFFNSLSEVVAGIGRSLPGAPQVEPTMFAEGGMTLQWLWAAGRAPTLIDAGGWDFVVLQEQSALGAGSEVGGGRLSPPGIFHQSVRTFVPRIRSVGATPLLLMTWARRERPDDQALLTDAYDTIGRELGVTVAPAGLAWEAARRQWPALALHVEDGSHPNPTGTYLSALVLYATLTGRDPRGAAARIDGRPYSRRLQGVSPDETTTLVNLDTALARRLQAIAWDIVTQRGLGKG